jgi:hypothetical protein
MAPTGIPAIPQTAWIAGATAAPPPDQGTRFIPRKITGIPKAQAIALAQSQRPARLVCRRSTSAWAERGSSYPRPSASAQPLTTIPLS